jgi:type IV pilus assembly protein PilW
VLYSKSAKLFNLGATPVRNVYYINGTDLMLSSGLGVTTNTRIAENIVQLAVQYGKDKNLDGLVETFESTAPLVATDWAQVLAIRVALVARSTQQEKPSVQGGTCDATPNTPTWSWGSANLSADPNWHCYRYKTFETVVPIRNLIWNQT